jgi:hypothetical protein
MQSKVMANCYRSLEEFTTDFRLVISNATSFNPPETLYHTEALRISAFGLEQISRASATVIQYETDWTIEVVEDDIQPPLQMDQGPNARPGAGRSPSVQPQPTGLGRRGLRGTQSKRISTAPSNAKAETGVPQDQIIDGRLPGSFDGVGAFPPGCAWAKMIVELKIKGQLSPLLLFQRVYLRCSTGKRYKSKRERLRIEKEGPPYHLDGSLDYCACAYPKNETSRSLIEVTATDSGESFYNTLLPRSRPPEKAISYPTLHDASNTVSTVILAAHPVLYRTGNIYRNLFDRFTSKLFDIFTRHLSTRPCERNHCRALSYTYPNLPSRLNSTSCSSRL